MTYTRPGFTQLAVKITCLGQHIGHEDRVAVTSRKLADQRKHFNSQLSYHAKKAAGMPGQKAMMAVARKFLKLLWGLNRSAQDYSQPRVFCCASQFRRRPTEQPLAQAA